MKKSYKKGQKSYDAGEKNLLATRSEAENKTFTNLSKLAGKKIDKDFKKQMRNMFKHILTYYKYLGKKQGPIINVEQPLLEEISEIKIVPLIEGIIKKEKERDRRIMRLAPQNLEAGDKLEVSLGDPQSGYTTLVNVPEKTYEGGEVNTEIPVDVKYLMFHFNIPLNDENTYKLLDNIVNYYELGIGVVEVSNDDAERLIYPNRGSETEATASLPNPNN